MGDTYSIDKALDGAGYALGMCAQSVGVSSVHDEALAAAAVIAYLNFRGRVAEADRVAALVTARTILAEGTEPPQRRGEP